MPRAPNIKHFYFETLHQRLQFVYNCTCDACSGSIQLKADPKEINPLLNAVESAYKQLVKNGSYKPEDLSKYKAFGSVIEETNKLIQKSVDSWITHSIPEAMKNSLKNDVFLFSAFKTHAQLFDASRMLTNDDGSIRTFHQFQKAVETIYKDYNINYLDAERTFALTAAQQAANWIAIEENGDRYNLQYRTAMDEQVRAQHQAMEGITLPPSDQFWKMYYPPNGWRCRCVAVEVNKDKYEVTDSSKAIEAGEAATTKINASGKNTLEIFRFNPGMEKIIFPKNHPYYKLQGAGVIYSSMKKQTTIKTLADLNDYFKSFAESQKQYFARGFKALVKTSKRGVNGYTDMNGNIWLKTDRMNEVIQAINAIESGAATTFAQEDALSTLHHEIWHNANKVGYIKQTKLSTRTMELANEFVSRKTLPKFMKNLGGELQNMELTVDRQSTGYNTMVQCFDELISWAKCDQVKALEVVQQHLINKSYNDQMTGLMNAIKESSEYNIPQREIQWLVSAARDARNVETYKQWLSTKTNLFIKK